MHCDAEVFTALVIRRDREFQIRAGTNFQPPPPRDWFITRLGSALARVVERYELLANEGQAEHRLSGYEHALLDLAAAALAAHQRAERV